jgi:hypothetical protein
MTSEAISFAVEKKKEGNDLFSSKKFAEAVGCYSEALKKLTPSSAEAKELIVILHSNRAACYLGIMEWDMALKVYHMRKYTPHTPFFN